MKTVFEKVDELETIMLGKGKGDPKNEWLRDKFDDLRADLPKETYIFKVALVAMGAGSFITIFLMMIVEALKLFF